MDRLFAALAFTLLAIIPSYAQEKRAGPPANTLREMGAALWSCWFPPAGTQNFQVTIIFSFKRNGEVLGKPRITYSTFNGDVQEQQRIMGLILDLARSVHPGRRHTRTRRGDRRTPLHHDVRILRRRRARTWPSRLIERRPDCAEAPDVPRSDL